ncbi:cache domain-containing protein, partial [Paenibacillus sp. 598K]|uniref:cache domain-containing protein n=1 Tax=Paenibacillus sp. 598K TaxID=1117987 RepID=UPI00162346A8
MFSSLDKRMKIILQVVILLYVLLSSLFVFLTIKSRSLDLQHQLALQYTGQQHQNAQLFMKWIEELARIVTSNGNVQQAIAGGAYDKSITPLLDGMSASNLYILDMVLYGVDGSIYASSRVSGFRTFDEVRAIPEYREFLASERPSQWLILDTGSLVYHQSDPRRRLIYLEKLAAGDHVTPGLLVMDVDLRKMTSFYAFRDPDAYPDSQAFLYTRDQTVVDIGGWTP